VKSELLPYVSKYAYNKKLIFKYEWRLENIEGADVEVIDVVVGVDSVEWVSGWSAVWAE